MKRFVVTEIQQDLFRVWDAATTETIADYDNRKMAEDHAAKALQSYRKEMEELNQ